MVLQPPGPSNPPPVLMPSPVVSVVEPPPPPNDCCNALKHPSRDSKFRFSPNSPLCSFCNPSSPTTSLRHWTASGGILSRLARNFSIPLLIRSRSFSLINPCSLAKLKHSSECSSQYASHCVLLRHPPGPFPPTFRAISASWAVITPAFRPKSRHSSM